MKQRYYNIKKLKALNCDYNMILGERSNGKSYAVKHDCLQTAYNDTTGQSKFIYLRRWDLELKGGLVEQYFADANIALLTNNESDCIAVYKGQIYLGIHDESNKIIKQRVVGYARALSMEEHYTSGIYTDVKNIIYEEFISRQGYLSKEPQKLQQFISTIARRNKIQVWLVGNTISRLCPYFTEWELRNIPRQKQGTIDIYEHATDQTDNDNALITIKIAVEYAENSGNNSQMFFGKTSKMITSGAWQSEEKPHLQKRVEEYNLMHELVFEHSGFKFLCKFLTDEDGGAFWYVEPKTTPIKSNTRVISDIVAINAYATRGFIPLCKAEQVAFAYLRQGVIFYSDNLTGADFEACIKKILTI